MIVRPRPSAAKLFFITRGSIIKDIVPQLTMTTLVALVTSLFRDDLSRAGITLTPLPFSLIGLALAIFLGFKNTASYDRFWEARKLWGELVNTSRSLTRQIQTFLPDSPLTRSMIRDQIAYAFALRTHLRPEHVDQDVKRYVESSEVEAILGSINVPNALLRKLGRSLKLAIESGSLNPQQVQSMDASLNVLTDILGGCERIRATPIPFSYTLLLHRTAYIYCFLLPFGLVDSAGLLMPAIVTLVSYTFFGLEALGAEIEEPFGTATNDLPLNSICRAIERDLLESLGEQDLPPVLVPDRYQLL